MRLPYLPAFIVAALASTPAACSSDVVVDPEGGGGSGASSSTDTATTGGPTGSVDMSSSGSFDVSSSTGTPSCAMLLDQPYLLSVSTNLSPEKAFAFELTIAGGTLPDDVTVKPFLQPLSAEDQQTPVCEMIMAYGQVVADDGSFTWDFGDIRICPEANPISGSEIQTSLILSGSFCTSTPGFGCGDVSGIVSTPIPNYDLTGSTFTTQAFEGPEKPAPLIDCAMTPAQY